MLERERLQFNNISSAALPSDSEKKTNSASNVDASVTFHASGEANPGPNPDVEGKMNMQAPSQPSTVCVLDYSLACSCSRLLHITITTVTPFYLYRRGFARTYRYIAIRADTLTKHIYM